MVVNGPDTASKMFEPLHEYEENPDTTFVRLWRRETRVTAAITTSELDSWRRGFSIEPLKSFFDDHMNDVVYTNVHNYQRILYRLYSPNSIRPVRVKHEKLLVLNEVLRASTVNWCNIDFNIDFCKLNDIDLFIRLHSIRIDIETIITSLQISTECTKQVRSNATSAIITACDEWIMFEAGTTKLVIPWLALIAFQDSIVGLMDVIIHTYVTDLTLKTKNFPTVLNVINFCFATIDELGGNCYNVFKSWLPCVIGNIIRSEPENLINGLYDEIMNDMPNCSLKTYFMTQLIDRDVKILNISLTGLAKCFTYPIVNITSAVKNVLGKALPVKHCRTGGEHILWMFRKIFIRDWIRKHRSWPPVKIIGPVIGPILEAQRQSIWTEVSGEWTPDMFKNIEIGHCLNFNWQIDAEENLADKSMSVGLESWPREYDYRYHNIKYGRPCKPGPVKERRFILEHIKRKVVDTHDSILKVLKSKAGASIFAHVMCIKERELSLEKARCFTKLTFDVRLFQITLENNMKEIFKYFPHQSMVQSSTALTMYMLRSSAIDALKTSIDFSNWSLNMCHTLIILLALQIDKIFNTPGLYESVDLIPQKSLFLSR